MQQIGLTLLITGLLGIPIFGLIGLGLPIGVGVALWAAIGAIFTAIGLWRHGGVGNWLRQPIDMGGSAQAMTVFCAGLIFAAMGVGIIACGRPGTDSRAMDRNEIVFFGSIFLLSGIGVCGIATSTSRIG